ncbi:hypothetical protein T459_09377 [Capsicum annuum]|uniref:Uncharacterized protein n=1 Tax=Capsicum annuum TaxID=4072 RepID=A0A2G2ZZ89_CAPAN|nr:hypothetical protein T459_09377 [Capsicum annuum]
MKRVGQMRNFYDTWINDISPMAMKVLNDNTASGCSSPRKLESVNYISHWYNRETYINTYSFFIQPILNMKMWPQSHNISDMSPPVRKMSGRPGKNRKKEEGAPAAGTNTNPGLSSSAGTVPSAGPSAAPTVEKGRGSTGRGRGRPPKDSTEKCAGRPRMVGMGLLHTQSRCTILNDKRFFLHESFNHKPQRPIHLMETPSQIRDLHSRNISLLVEIETLRASNQSLQSELTQKDELLHQTQLQKDDALKKYVDLSKERDTLRVAIQRLEDDFYEETERIRTELEVSRKKAEELVAEKREQSEVCSRNLEIMQSAKHGLMRLVENLDLTPNRSGDSELKSEKTKLLNEKSTVFSLVVELVNLVEEKWGEYEETRKKEKRELEKSVMSLTEENRDASSLLKIALVEKEAAEKSLNRLRGNTEQKKAAILQIAERGLQRVGFGFGFMMGSATTETSSDNDECEKEAVTLASTVETITKKLRVEITQLQKSLEESRSDMESLQHLSDKQSQKLAENMIYIKELEDKKMMLTQKVEELMNENKEAEEEISRWREACEMEVEAGKKAIKENKELANIQKEELEKTRTALRTTNSMLKLKDELEEAAICAREAAERDLQLADSRATELRKQIVELTKQLEVAGKKEQINRRRVRHVCWPMRSLKFCDATNTTAARNVTRMLPEMQAFIRNT